MHPTKYQEKNQNSAKVENENILQLSKYQRKFYKDKLILQRERTKDGNLNQKETEHLKKFINVLGQKKRKLN